MVKVPLGGAQFQMPTGNAVPTLIGHLAQFSTFAKQGELLCTQSLAYLLRNAEATEAFTAHFLKPAGICFSGNLSWKAEARQADLDRPDLEATTSDKRPVAKIEAKLCAALSEGQLVSYVSDLQKRANGGLLLLLVPSYRLSEATELATKTFALSGDGPQWRIGSHPGCVVTVASWEEIRDILAKNSSPNYGSDFEQFRDLYGALNGDYYEPPPSGEWREREAYYLTLVDRVTRRLTASGPILPMGPDVKSDPRGYQRRYVCLSSEGAKASCYAIGVRDPFVGYDTPIWLRFHHGTGMFDEIRQRLKESNFSPRLVEQQSHVWLPLDLPSAEGDVNIRVEALVKQAKEIELVAYLRCVETVKKQITRSE